MGKLDVALRVPTNSNDMRDGSSIEESKVLTGFGACWSTTSFMPGLSRTAVYHLCTCLFSTAATVTDSFIMMNDLS